MEAPFGIIFLKKAELFNLVSRFDKQYGGSPSNNPWLIERQILRWTYGHHKHLGSPIKTEHLSLGSQNNKLRDFRMIDSKGRLRSQFKYLEKNSLTKPLENLVIRGFANYYNESEGHNAIVINKDGLLVGEVITDMEKDNIFIKANYLFYSHMMDHLGATVMMVVTIIGLIKLFISFFYVK